MRIRGGLAIGLVMLALVAGAAPGAAQPPAARPGRAPRQRVPMPMLMAQRDPELTNLVRDIVILRALNTLGLSKEQIEKVIPALEEIAAAERALRDEARRQLLAERQRLLAGTATAEESGRALGAIADARRRYAAQLEQAQGRLGQVLTPQQMEKLKRLAGGMERAAAPAPGAAPPPEFPLLRALGAGPSAEAMGHIISLLKEKLAAM